jgi:hypothetical protein
MSNYLRAGLAAAIILGPAAAYAQYIVQEPPQVVYQTPMAVQQPAGPLSVEDAANVAMMHGMARVEDVDRRIWDGNYKVKGTDMTGETVVMRIDRMTGQILDIDD